MAAVAELAEEADEVTRDEWICSQRSTNPQGWFAGTALNGMQAPRLHRPGPFSFNFSS
jgi:hypothetical protein